MLMENFLCITNAILISGNAYVQEPIETDYLVSIFGSKKFSSVIITKPDVSMFSKTN